MNELQKLIDQAQFGIAVVTKEGETLYVNPWFRAMARGDIMDVPKIREWLLSLSDKAPSVSGSGEELPARHSAVLTVATRSHGYSYVHVSAMISRENNWLVSCVPVSAEEGYSALCEFETNRFGPILEAIPMAILVVGSSGKAEACSSKVGEIFRLSDEAILSAADTHPLQFMDIRLRDPDSFKEFIKKAEIEPEESLSQRVELVDGRLVDVFSSSIQIEKGNVGRVWSFSETSGAPVHGAELSTGEIRYRTLFEHFPLGIISCNSQGDITELNHEVWRILGLKERDQIGDLNVLKSEVMINAGITAAVKKCLDTGEAIFDDLKFVSPSGTEIFSKIYVAGVQGNDNIPVGAVAVLEDISDQKRAEDLVLHSQRLKVLGQMAGGVTHSFSNHLQVITGNANMAINNVEAESYQDLKLHLEQILDAANTAGDIVRRLQLLSREKPSGDSPQRTPVDAGRTVNEAVEMCKLWAKSHVDKKRISISYKVDISQGCYVEVNQDDLIEIVLNLLKNAVEALEENGAIRVNVSADTANVFIRVRDNGVGISKQDIDNIVAPFWSSKKGHTGMGLAVSSSLLRSYKGGIAIKRVKPKGVIFTVRLPRVKTPPVSVSSDPKSSAGRKYRILLIDDDKPVVNILGKGLTRLGNKTFVAFSGPQGLEILEEHNVDAIICDLGMEGMDGWEVSGEVLSVCVEKGIPKPPFILLTGWAGQLAEDEILYHPHVDKIVEKPITIVNLLDIVQKEIEKGSSV